MVILCGTMARQLEAATLLLPVVDQLVELLSGLFYVSLYSDYSTFIRLMPSNIYSSILV